MQQICVRCGPNGDRGQARANVEIPWLMRETDWEQRGKYGTGLISGLGGSSSQKSPNLIITNIPMIP